MLSRLVCGIAVAGMSLGLIPAHLIASESPPAAGGERFITVDEIRPGMRGTGLATFGSEGVTEFEVQVLGVLHRWVPGGDLIVVEATGGPLAETGIYRGMSGSPIYLEGRLAGAVSYNLGLFAERAIAGVTPIAEMLPLLEGSEESPAGEVAPGTLPPGKTQGKGPTGDPEEAPEVEAAVASPRSLAGHAFFPADVEPIRTPLLLAGFAPETRAAMAPFLSRFGVETTSGGASGRLAGNGSQGMDAARAALKPGAPLGVQLVRGDVEATALGTVTYVDGDRLLAFGHPMFQAGQVDLPMTGASVYTVYPSQAVSFVIGAASGPLGRIVTDRQTGIAGRVGETAPMVPVRIEIQRDGSPGRSYEFEIVPNKFFLAQFVGFVAFNSFVADQKVFGDTTLDLSLRVELADGTRLDFEDVLASNLPPTALAERVSAPVNGLLFNDLAPVRIKRIDLDLRVLPQLKTAVIEEVVVDRYEVEAGESIAATLHLKPFEAARRSIQLTVPVPADARPGPILLRACDAEGATRWESERAPRRFVPSTVAQLVDLYEETAAHNVVRVTLHGDAHGVVVDGREMPGLPSSVFKIMDSNRRTGGRSGSWGRLLHEQRVKTEYQLSGCQELRLEVKASSVKASDRAAKNGANGVNGSR